MLLEHRFDVLRTMYGTRNSAEGTTRKSREAPVGCGASLLSTRGRMTEIFLVLQAGGNNIPSRSTPLLTSHHHHDILSPAKGLLIYTPRAKGQQSRQKRINTPAVIGLLLCLLPPHSSLVHPFQQTWLPDLYKKKVSAQKKSVITLSDDRVASASTSGQAEGIASRHIEAQQIMRCFTLQPSLV